MTPGHRPFCALWARAPCRHLARVTGIDALNRASMVEAQGLRDMRMRALDAIYRVAPGASGADADGLGARG
jgi:2-octaprenyl-6-methoxyphenol hydroxylase